MGTGEKLDSGFVLFPGGHAANKTVDLHEVMTHKFKLLGKMAMDKNELINFVLKLENIADMKNEDLATIYEAKINFMERSIDAPIQKE